MTDDYYGRTAEARTRRRRTSLTILIVLLILFFAAWYAMSYLQAEDTQAAPSTTTSSTSSSTAPCPEPADVQVNVYNATNRAGLAAEVATDLRARGFDVKTVANDPKRAQLTGPGQLRYGSAGAKGAERVLGHVGNFERQIDERQRPSVDVVLGPQYEQLVPPAKVPTC